MDEIIKKLEKQDKKIEAIYNSVEKIRKYFLITIWITIIVIVLPAIGLFFAVPAILETYTTAFSGI